jgi:hypothetical protein
MQFIWRPFFEHLGKSTQIFTSAMYDHYCWPTGFWNDAIFNGDSPVITDPTISTNNEAEKLEEMFDYIMHYNAHYQGNHIMIPMGCDFTYSNAVQNFRSLDHLIAAFNEKIPDIKLQYSTPGQYLDNLIGQYLTWPTKYDDMFPYADFNEDYWTGYFTSRANAKGYIRTGQAQLHASGQLIAQ